MMVAYGSWNSAHDERTNFSKTRSWSKLGLMLV